VHLEVFVEEQSAEEALKNLIPKIIGADHSFQIHPFQGKQQLLKELPSRLKGIKYMLSLPDVYVIVLIDRDQNDCKALKAKLEEIAKSAGLFTKSHPGREGTFQVVNRLAIEELEAWFFGDVKAIHIVYPKISSTLGKKRKYRNPDAIRGGTWEALERELKQKGYYSGGLPKIEVAREISKRMDPTRNLSQSFRIFRDALLFVVSRTSS